MDKPSDAASVAAFSGTSARSLVIETVARRFGLPPALVLAICRTESSLDPFAMRHEPAYRWLWDVGRNQPFDLGTHKADLRLPPKGFTAAPGVSQLTEWMGQQTSWGLMQVMGAVAREQGFLGPFPALCDTATGTEIGCRHLARYRDRYLAEHGWHGVIAAYNAGHPKLLRPGVFVNQAYVAKVLANGAGAVL